jgi:DNA-directed RNA polymerase subunit RPC12/RpoP
MLKCSFCEQTLACNHCGKPFRPRQSETHVAAYQPDMEIYCPECQHKLVCKACGFVYGEPVGEDDA